MAKVIDGNKLAEEKEAELRHKVEGLRGKGIAVKLAVLVMADDEAGKLYSQLKQEAGKRIGIEVEKVLVGEGESDRLVELVERYNQDEAVQGIMVQHPGVGWGKRQDMNREEFEAWWDGLVRAIEPDKDVDGLRQDSRFTLAAVRAVNIVLEENGISRGKMVVVGSRGLIGRRLVEYFSKKDFEVKGLDIGDDLETATAEAEVLISATGKSGLIKKSMVKKGAAVIDMGWPRGDVEFDEVKDRAGLITPVPGGIGPLTVVSLLENLVDSL